MDKETIINEIKAIITDVTEIPEEEIYVDRAMMEDLDMSSLEILSIVAELERKFKVRIPEKTLREFITINDIAEFIRNHV